MPFPVPVPFPFFSFPFYSQFGLFHRSTRGPCGAGRAGTRTRVLTAAQFPIQSVRWSHCTARCCWRGEGTEMGQGQMGGKKPLPELGIRPQLPPAPPRDKELPTEQRPPPPKYVPRAGWMGGVWTQPWGQQGPA